jgi:TATA-box binding protein (TBP) (component of TFIID and TFIIIB)
MIKYRSEQVTLLIFTSFRFRLMGGGGNHVRVLRKFIASLPWRDEVNNKVTEENLRLSNMTVTHQLPYDNINLQLLAKRDSRHFRVELEIFPAAHWLHGSGGEHVNIFHTGRVVITGVPSINKAEHLLRELQSQLLCHFSTSSTSNITTAPPPLPSVI